MQIHRITEYLRALTGQVQPTGGSGRPERVRGGGPTETEGAGRGDEVELSARVREFQRARQAVAEAPEVRADRVEALRAQIATGTYEVNVRGLVRRLLELAGVS